LTVANEEVDGWIKDMGYVTVTPRHLEPSYYKLKDGSIIKALIYVNHLIPAPSSPDGFTVSSTNLITAFVPKDKRRPEAFQPYHQADIQSGILDDDMEPEPLRENFSVYDLSNGMVLSVKTVAGQISKTRYYTKDGEPIYTVNATPVIKTKKK
jgi:hypothetical protein